MPSITSGSNATISVNSGQILTVLAQNGSEFTYENPVGTRVVESASNSVFGPFTTTTLVKLSSVQGALYYELATPSQPINRPFILAQSGVPVILPSSGSSNASGQITLTTALPYQPVGTVQVYLPAGVVVGDAVGGLKQAVFSSTTVFQLVGNPVTANGAYTQTTSSVALASLTVPGGAMGANGALRFSRNTVMLNNANTKAATATFGGSLISSWTVTTASVSVEQRTVRNRGSQAVQSLWPDNTSGVGSGTFSAAQIAVDSGVSQTLGMTAQLAVATDYIILEGYTVEILPGN